MFWYEFLQEEKKRTGNGLEFPWRALVLLLLSVRSLHMLVRSLTSSCHHLGHQTSYPQFSSFQFSCSVVSDSLPPHGLPCTPGFPVHHQLPELAQTHVHQVTDAIQPSHPLSSPSPPAFNLSQHQGFFPRNQFFAWGGQSIGVSASASVLPMNIQD